MRLSPLAAVAAAFVLTLTACSDDGSDPESSDQSESPSASDGDQPKGKNGKGKKSEAPDLGAATVCEGLDAGDVGEVVGTEVELTPVGDNSCSFANPDDPSSTSVTVAQISVEAAGGAKTLKRTFTTMLDGDAEEVTGVGDRAYVLVTPGRQRAGASASGAFIDGDSVVQVSMASASVLSKAEARGQATDLMELAVAAL